VRNCTFLLDFAWLLQGLRPQRNWTRNALRRVREFLRPNWPIDSDYDLLDCNDWLCDAMLLCQGFAASLKSLATGKSIGQTILEDENYDPVAVGRLRQVRRTLAVPGPVEAPNRKRVG
jgi:hypothetical protein